MRAIYTVVISVASALYVAPAISQSSAVDAAVLRPIGLPGSPAKDAFVIDDDGKVIKVKKAPNLRLQSEVLTRPEAAKDFLARHNLADNDKTRDMLKALNPTYDAAKGELAAGSKVDIFSVTSNDPDMRVSRKFTFDTPNVTRFAFYSQAKRASEISEAAVSLPTGSFDAPSSARLHVRATQDVQSAAKTLETKSDKLSKLDIAVAQFQIDYASKQAEEVNASAKLGSATHQQVVSTAASAAAAKATAERINAGKPAAELINLRVNVFRGETSEHAKSLQVYVLPSGALEKRGWTQAEIEMFLNHFIFANEASPVAQDIPMNFDPRVCIGPKNAISGMAQLILDGRLKTCRKPNFPVGASYTELTFRSPDDIARP